MKPKLDDEDLFDTAFSMIHARWGLKLQIVQLVRRQMRRPPGHKNWPAGWAWISHRDVGNELNCSRQWAWHLLDQLVDDGVLLCDLAGAGTRPSAYRLNPRVEQWANVPWREKDHRLVMARLELARAFDRGTTPPPAPRAYGAAQGSAAPRPHAAAQEDLVPREETADLTDRQGRDIDRGTSAPTRPRTVIDEDSLERGRRIIEAIERKTGAEVWGRGPRNDIFRVVAPAVELSKALEVIAAADPTDRVPRVVAALRALAKGLPVAGDSHDDARAKLRAHIAALEREIAVNVEIEGGAMDPEDPWLVSKQEELAQARMELEIEEATA